MSDSSQELIDNETQAVEPVNKLKATEEGLNTLDIHNCNKAEEVSSIIVEPKPQDSDILTSGDEKKDTIIFRPLEFKDLEGYKSLLKNFPHGFIGILFKEICDNDKGEFYSYGAFEGPNKLIGMIIGIKDYAQIRQFTDLEAGIAAMTGKRLSHIITIIVDPKYQRLNIGTQLLDGFLKFVGDDSAKFVLIPHKNIPAQQFFESQDFGALSTLRKFYDEHEDALLFVDKKSRGD